MNMARISAKDLVKIKEKTRQRDLLTEAGDTVKITVHLGTCGLAAGGDKVYEALKEEIKKSDREDIRIVISGCAGMCSSEPNVTIRRMGEDAVIYRDVDADKMRDIFQGHVLQGAIPEKHAMARIK
jgi:NADP-reducing hydrogenase subunit HndB